MISILLTLGSIALLGGCPNGDGEICGVTEARSKGEQGASCNVAEDCSTALGCVEERCSSCTESAQCGQFLACNGGACGACSESAPCAEDEDCVDGICLPEVKVWELTVDPHDWETLQEEIYDDDLYFDCQLRIEGVEYPNCTTRIQGASSRYYPKKSIRLRFPEDAETPGFSRKVNLRTEWADPSFMRTWLGYATFRRLGRTPTVRTKHVFLRVNGEDYGLMNEVERLGGKFMARNGRDRDQSLYEAESAPPMGALMPMPDAEAYRAFEDHLMYTKKGGDPDDFSDLIHLIEDQLWVDFENSRSRSNTAITETEQAVALEQQVEYLALESLLQNRDHIQSNFHMSYQRDVDGRMRWEFYPWDLDTTFGCHRPEGEDTTICEVMIADVWPFVGVISDGMEVGWPARAWINLLAHQTLNERTCSARFREELCGFVNSQWWEQDVIAAANAMEKHLDPWVARDLNDRNDTLDDFHRAVDKVTAFPADRAAFLRQEIGCQ